MTMTTFDPAEGTEPVAGERHAPVPRGPLAALFQKARGIFSRSASRHPAGESPADHPEMGRLREMRSHFERARESEEETDETFPEPSSDNNLCDRLRPLTSRQPRYLLKTAVEKAEREAAARAGKKGDRDA